MQDEHAHPTLWTVVEKLPDGSPYILRYRDPVDAQLIADHINRSNGEGKAKVVPPVGQE